MIAIPTNPLRLLPAFGLVASLLACSSDAELQSYRASIPARQNVAQWSTLAPLAAFEPLRPLVSVPDPRSLAARAAGLRQRARGLQGPVISPVRRRAMVLALRTYGHR